MTRTVIGLFDTSEAARAAERALIGQGIARSAVSLMPGEPSQAETAAEGQTIDPIRRFLAGIFGPDNIAQARAYADEIESGRTLLSVEVPDDRDLVSICEAMQDAEVLDMDTPHWNGAPARRP